MKYVHFTPSVFFSVVIAAGSISLQGFDSEQCAGNQVTTALSNPGNQFEASGCVPSNQFHSVILASASTGFQCNIYSDTACSNFLETLDAVNTCSNIIGAGVICFNQALFSNPLADSTPAVTIGKNKITTALDESGVSSSPTFQADVVHTAIGNVISQACGDNGCDPTNKATIALDHSTCQTFETQVCTVDATCQQSITMTGNYDNTNQRDYMKGLLQATFASTHVFNDPVQGILKQHGPSITNIGLSNILSFAQVVIC